MKEALPILDKNSNVQRYSWMSARDNKVPGASLFTNNNNPMNPQFTKVGQFYANTANN